MKKDDEIKGEGNSYDYGAIVKGEEGNFFP